MRGCFRLVSQVSGAQLDAWRANFKGVRTVHEASGLELFGAIDDLWRDLDQALRSATGGPALRPSSIRLRTSLTLLSTPLTRSAACRESTPSSRQRVSSMSMIVSAKGRHAATSTHLRRSCFNWARW